MNRSASRAAVSEFAFNAVASCADERAVAFDEESIAKHGLRTLSPHVMDLIEIIAAVHLADRLSKRPSAVQAGNSWSRHIRVHMGVRDPAHWDHPELEASLTSILMWLTDDRWEFKFSTRQASARRAESVQFLFEQPAGGDVLALFSGGLDSVAGVIDDIEAGVRPIALSVGSNGRMRGRQSAVLQQVARTVGSSLPGVPVRLHLRHTPAVEQSQRARGFAFLGLAATAAVSLGLQKIHVYENGVGALNLPYTAAQSGAHGTHSMHPMTLLRMEEFLRRALSADLTITNRCQFDTKAEMCRRLATKHWPALQASQSCDTAFAARVSGPEACGQCTSCIFRRQSLHGAGLGHLDSVSGYRLDVLDPSSWFEVRAYPLRAMVAQASQLGRALNTRDPQRSLMAQFPDLAIWIGSQPPEHRFPLFDKVVRLLGAYVQEWSALPSDQVQRALSLAQPDQPLSSAQPDGGYGDW